MAFIWKKSGQDSVSNLIRDSRESAKEVLETVPRAPRISFVQARRKDYKGERIQFLLRVTTDLKRDIELVSFARHISQNELCANIIQEAVSLYVDQLKDDPKWEMIESAFLFYREEE